MLRLLPPNDQLNLVYAQKTDVQQRVAYLVFLDMLQLMKM